MATTLLASFVALHSASAPALPATPSTHTARTQDAAAQADSTRLCQPFLKALGSVPHVALSVTTGAFVSIWDEKPYEGCDVAFETNDSLLAGATVPDFDALEDSEMSGLGWRTTRGIRADGPGSGVYGLEKGSVTCVVRWAQTAYVDDDGEYIQLDTFTMRVQCRER